MIRAHAQPRLAGNPTRPKLFGVLIFVKVYWADTILFPPISCAVDPGVLTSISAHQLLINGFDERLWKSQALSRAPPRRIPWAAPSCPWLQRLPQTVLSCLQMLLDTNTHERLKRSSWCVMGSSFRDKGTDEQAGDTPGCPCVQPVPLLPCF